MAHVRVPHEPLPGETLRACIAVPTTSSDLQQQTILLDEALARCPVSQVWCTVVLRDGEVLKCRVVSGEWKGSNMVFNPRSDKAGRIGYKCLLQVPGKKSMCKVLYVNPRLEADEVIQHRRSEVERLHASRGSDGTLKPLDDTLLRAVEGYRIAPSQVHVEPFIMDDTVDVEFRKKIEDELKSVIGHAMSDKGRASRLQQEAARQAAGPDAVHRAAMSSIYGTREDLRRPIFERGTRRSRAQLVVGKKYQLLSEFSCEPEAPHFHVSVLGIVGEDIGEDDAVPLALKSTKRALEDIFGEFGVVGGVYHGVRSLSFCVAMNSIWVWLSQVLEADLELPNGRKLMVELPETCDPFGIEQHENEWTSIKAWGRYDPERTWTCGCRWQKYAPCVHAFRSPSATHRVNMTFKQWQSASKWNHKPGGMGPLLLDNEHGRLDVHEGGTPLPPGTYVIESINANHETLRFETDEWQQLSTFKDWWLAQAQTIDRPLPVGLWKIHDRSVDAQTLQNDAPRQECAKCPRRIEAWACEPYDPTRHKGMVSGPHMNDKCLECQKKGLWCSGSLHKPYVSVSYDIVTRAIRDEGVEVAVTAANWETLSQQIQHPQSVPQLNLTEVDIGRFNIVKRSGEKLISGCYEVVSVCQPVRKSRAVEVVPQGRKKLSQRWEKRAMQAVPQGSWTTLASQSWAQPSDVLAVGLQPVLRWEPSAGGLEASIQYEGHHVILQMRPWIFIHANFQQGLLLLGEKEGDAELAELIQENRVPAGCCELKTMLAALNASISQTTSAARLSRWEQPRHSPAAGHAGEYQEWGVRTVARPTQSEHTEFKNAIADFLLNLHPRIHGGAAESLPLDSSTMSGWLRIPLRTDGLIDPTRSETAFHGASDKNCASIVMRGLLRPSQHARGSRGQAFSRTKDSIYVTPSLAYAAHPVYSKFFRVGSDGQCRWGQIVVEVRCRRDSYRAFGNSLGDRHWEKRLIIDPKFPTNLGLEWLTESSENVEAVALLYRELGDIGEESRAVFGDLVTKVRERHKEQDVERRKPEYSWTDLLQSKRREDRAFRIRQRGSLIVFCRGRVRDPFICLVHTRPGQGRPAQLGIPGGTVDARDCSTTGCSAELRAAVRELKEETGLALGRDGVHLFSRRSAPAEVFSAGEPGMYSSHTVYFLAEADQRSSLTSECAREIEKCEWMPLSEAIRKVHYQSDRLALQAAQERIVDAPVRKIQTLFRTWSAHRAAAVRLAQASARKIQALFRTWSAQRAAAGRLASASACRIQSFFRAWRARRAAMALHVAAPAGLGEPVLADPGAGAGPDGRAAHVLEGAPRGPADTPPADAEEAPGMIVPEWQFCVLSSSHREEWHPFSMSAVRILEAAYARGTPSVIVQSGSYEYSVDLHSFTRRNTSRPVAGLRRIRRFEPSSFALPSQLVPEWEYQDGRGFHPFSPTATLVLEAAFHAYERGVGPPELDVMSGSFRYKVDLRAMHRHNLDREGVHAPRHIRRRVAAEGGG